jgi:hypothetical protein
MLKTGCQMFHLLLTSIRKPYILILAIDDSLVAWKQCHMLTQAKDVSFTAYKQNKASANTGE